MDPSRKIELGTETTLHITTLFMSTITMTIAETSSSKPKKRKDRPTSETPELVRKKSKLGRSPADQSVDVSLSRKGKERAFVEDSKEFSVVGATVRVTIPPVFASDPEAGVEEMLDSMVMKCVAVNPHWSSHNLIRAQIQPFVGRSRSGAS